MIPVVVTIKQDVIAAGQIRPGDRLGDVMTARPGSILVTMEPLYPGDADDVPPGSHCIANAYSSFHDQIEDASFLTGIYYHAIDAVGVVHAAVIRIHALILPVQTLVLSGH